MTVTTKRKDGDGTGETSGDVLDELALDDSTYYKQKITKWVKNALHTVGDSSFWFMLFVAHKTRNPLLHFYRILCVNFKGVTDSGRMPVVELVSYRIDTIRQEYDVILQRFHEWTKQAKSFAKTNSESLCFDSGAAASGSKDITDASLFGLAAALLLHNAAAFDRRVARLFNRYLGCDWASKACDMCSYV